MKNQRPLDKQFHYNVVVFVAGEIDINQAVKMHSEHKIPDKFAKDVITSALKSTLDKSDAERVKTVKLLVGMKTESYLTTSGIQECFKTLCNALEERENEFSQIMGAITTLIATSVGDALMSLVDVASLTENGTYYPLFFTVLQQLHDSQVS